MESKGYYCRGCGKLMPVGYNGMYCPDNKDICNVKKVYYIKKAQKEKTCEICKSIYKSAWDNSKTCSSKECKREKHASTMRSIMKNGGRKRRRNRIKTNEPLKYKAWKMSRYIDKKPCEVCGSEEKIHRHHEDYAKPLEVNFLCEKHHLEIHGKKYRA